VRLAGQPFAILAILLEKPGEVVTREEMQRRLWPADTFVDFEHGLNSAIKKLRAALGDTPENSRYVETLPRVGYRFIAPVLEILPKLESVSKNQIVTENPNARTQEKNSAFLNWQFLLAAALLLAVFVVGYFGITHSWFRNRPKNGRIMLAVLPFENLTGDSGQEYFSDGLTEEMIAQLGRLDPELLGVIARTSVMHYKHNPAQLEEISRELGVQFVLEGSVRRDVDNVRVSAQLIQVRDQTHLWARQYDRKLSNLLVLQGEIAQDIAGGIELALNDQKAGSLTLRTSLSADAYEAHDLYLKGRYHWNKRTIEGFQLAIQYFQQAIEKDPSSAPAYAGLADSYALLSGYSVAPHAEFMPKARAAAQKALQLDANLPEAHTALALIAENYDWDWQTAEREYLRAIELNPNYATAHHWYAEYLTWLGRFDEALRENERARKLDPLSLIIATDRASTLYYSRSYDQAIEQFLSVQREDPSFPRTALVTYAYIQKKMYPEALNEIERNRRNGGDGPWAWSMLASVHGSSGQVAKARLALEKLIRANKSMQLDATPFVLAYSGMGEKEQALTWLEKAYSQRSNVLVTLRVEPAYDLLRSDPRFQDLLRRVGLAP
jgi:TolB-like protein/DNA-binding winged helix-turn-helix (wHTH) protein